MPSRPKPNPTLPAAMPAGQHAITADSLICERGWAIRLPRIRLADRLHPPGRFTIDAADPDWLLLAVVLEGTGRVACAEGMRAVDAGEALAVPAGQAVSVHAARWMRLLVVGGFVPALPMASPRPHVVRDAGSTIEQIARLGRNTRSIAAILGRFSGSAFDDAVDESVLALLVEILATRAETLDSHMA